jgi:hypothetical protein
MNERIKELAAKSNFGHMENGEVVYDHRLEKFAELIMQECCDVAHLNHFVNRLTLNYIMNKHFGIKE